LQHTISILKDNGRAAVVLDTGAVTRGSGSKNEDKERKIRQWFVEKDLVDGVILLPDNLFYNTTAAGIIIVLRMQKPKDRRGKITLVNASAEFKKGSPKNYIPDENIRKIADAFNDGNEVEGFVKIITTAEAAKNDFNLSPGRFVASAAVGIIRKLPDVLKDLAALEIEATAVNKDLKRILPYLSSAK
jgi:type I restriction enzyme M protein